MSKKEKPELREYSEDVQKVLLQFMMSSNTAFVRCQNIIKPDYWNDRLRPACRYIMKFADEYHALPTPEQVAAETATKIDILPNLGEQHITWFLDTIEEFCRHKAMEALVYDGPKLIELGQYAELERRSKENMMISLQNDLGTDYWDNPLERLQRMRDRSGMMSTGWRDIDRKLNGGMNRGELTFFAGGPGTGKSLFLQNLALNWVQMGLNVVYITLELSEDLVGLRFDAMITQTSTKMIFKDMENVAMRLGMLPKQQVKKWGKLQIKKMSEGGTTCNDIRAYLKEYEIQTGNRPDAILVDYLDLLYPNSNKIDLSSAFTKDKFTSEELRAVAGEWNILCASASQLNRQSTQEQDFDVSHIAGGISKINTADNVMGIYVTTAMKERGDYQIQFLKTRSSSGVGSRVMLKFDQASLRIVDAEEDDGYNPQSAMGNALAGALAKKVTSTVGDGPKQANLGSEVRPAAERHPEAAGLTRPPLGPISQAAMPTGPHPSKVAEQAARLRNMIKKTHD